jgi:hypothetical protein
MALRAFASQLEFLRFSGASLRMLSSGPTVFDKMVQFFVIDKAGVRHTVRGLVGQSVADAIKENDQIDPTVLMPHPYLPAKSDCHVYVAYDFLDKIPALSEEHADQEKRLIEDCARLKARENSRMAYFIPLKPELNGLTVAIGDMEPWQNE